MRGLCRIGTLLRVTVWGAIILCLGGIGFLRCGDPFRSKWAYLFQSYALPGTEPKLPPGYTGWARAWYANGRIASSCSYVSGRPQGLMRRWYPDGSPRLVCSYDQGKAEGEWTEWAPDGGVAMCGYYRAGTPWHGRCYIRMDKAWTATYRDGRLWTGMAMAYDEASGEHSFSFHQYGKETCTLNQRWEPCEGALVAWKEQEAGFVERVFRSSICIRETPWSGTHVWWADGEKRFARWIVKRGKVVCRH